MRGVLHSRIEKLNLWIEGSESRPFASVALVTVLGRLVRQTEPTRGAGELGVLCNAVEPFFRYIPGPSFYVRALALQHG